MPLLHVLGLTLPVLVPGIALIVTLRGGGFTRLRRPIDGGALWLGRPVLGANKTWYGLMLYPLGGAVTAGALSWGRGAVDPVLHGARGSLVGASVGAAYAVGELVNSFVKRRLGIAPGRMAAGGAARIQRSADLADGIVAACVVYVAWGVSLGIACGVLVTGIAIHVSTDALMRRLRLKRHEGGRRGGGDRHIVGSPRADAFDKGERHP